MADYCTLEEVRAELVKRGNSALDNNAIEERIPRATGHINMHCGHSFDDETIADERRRGQHVLMNADGILEITVAKGNCQSVSAASVSHDLKQWHALDVDTVDIDGYTLSFVGVTAPIDRGRPMFARVSYRGGFVPSDPRAAVINQVACRWVAFLYHKREAPFEITAFPEVGQISIPSAVPGDILQALKPFVRVRP